MSKIVDKINNLNSPALSSPEINIELIKDESEELSTSLGDKCCDSLCNDLNKEIYYRELSIGKTYTRRHPIPRATSMVRRDDHPSPTIEEFEYPSPTFDAEALTEFRDSLGKVSCKCSRLSVDPTEDEMKAMISSVRGLMKLSPTIVRQMYKYDIPATQANANSNCHTDVCSILNSQISELEYALNKEESSFKNDPKARGSSETYVPNIYKSHMLKQYRRDLKKKGINCII